MKIKYWYFVAEIYINDKWVVKYDGYLMDHDGFFQASIAKTQAVNRADISVEEIVIKGDKGKFLSDTFIINQIEVSEDEYKLWEIANDL